MKPSRNRVVAAALTVGLLAVSACAETTSDGADTASSAAATTTAAPASDTMSESDSMSASDTMSSGDSMSESDTMSSGDSMSESDTMSSSDTMSATGDAAGDTLQWALDYTGSTAGKASGDPIRIGWASSTDVFPDADTAAMVAADYINNELGGVEGRPIELVPCNMAAPEDGTKCGGQFANDESISIAMVGSAKQGTADFFTAIGDTKAKYTSTPLGIDDFVSKQSVSYVTGALGAGMGLAMFTLEFQPKTVAAVVTDDAAGQAGLGVFKPVVEASGATLVPVFIPPTSTAPDVESALTAAGAADADVIIVGVFEAACIASYDALKNLGISGTDKPILSTSNCYGLAVQEHLKNVGDPNQVPNGWYFSYYGSNPLSPDLESGMLTYTTVMEASGKAGATIKDGAPAAFAAVMTMQKFLIEAKGDYSAATLNGLIRDFKGPAMIQAGPIDCALSQTFSGVCASRVGISQYLNGEWIATHQGDDSVDITPPLTAGNS